MTWTLVVRSHGRWSYLDRCLTTIDELLPGFFDHRVLSVDGPAEQLGLPTAWEVRSTGPQRKGLAANVAQAWDGLDPDAWVFDVEEDFVLVDAPLEAMAAVLDAERDLAQMALVRQPWSEEEKANGGLLYGPNVNGEITDQDGWLRQRRIFTLNPYVAHASLLRSLSPGVEASLTEQCLARGLAFGFWGSVDDDPRAIHVGASGGMGSPGWLP